MKFNYFIGLLFALLMSFSAAAVEVVTLQVKEYDKNDAFIFYHLDFFQLDITYIDGNLIVKSRFPIDIRMLTPVSAKKLTYGPKIINSKTVSFKTKTKYKNFEIVRGERLTAIKFATDKTFDKIKHQMHSANKTEGSSAGFRSGGAKIDSKVSVKEDSNQLDIRFEFDSVVPAASFQRGRKLWVVFDKKKVFNFPEMKMIKSPRQLDSQDYSILYLELPAEIAPVMLRAENTWRLLLSKEFKHEEKEIKIQRLFDHYGVMFSGAEFSKVIDFKDPSVGDSISVITSKDSGTKVKSKYYFSDFTIYPTLVGTAVSWVAGEYKTEILEEDAKIYSLNNAIFAVDSELNNITVDYTKTALPVKYEIPGIFDFLSKRVKLYRDISDSSDKQAEYKAKYEIAKFFFSEAMYHETLSALRLIEFDLEFLSKNPEAPLMKSVALSMLGRYMDSEELLTSYMRAKIFENLKLEASIWSKYNRYHLKKSNEPIGVIKYLDHFMSDYTSDMYWNMIFAELEVGMANNDMDLMQNLLRKIKEPIYENEIDSLNYHKANFYKRTSQFNLAKNYYDELKTHNNDPENYTKAMFEKTMMLFANNQIDRRSAIKELDKLKYIWRGDKTELEILNKKVELLMLDEQYAEVLRTYRYMLSAFPTNSANVQISNEMAKIFSTKIFDPRVGSVSDMSDFDAIATYYEFRELTPIGSEGDELVLTIAKRMINLDLLEEAEKILNHQVSYRLQNKEKITYSDHLAAIYIVNKKPEKAIETLNNTDTENYGFLEHLARLKVKAKALLDMKKYADAIQMLREDDSVEAKSIKIEAYYRLQDWENLILTSEIDILPIIEVGKVLPELKERDALRLAIAYSMTNKNEELDYLVDNIKLSSEPIKKRLDLIKSLNEPIDILKLDSEFKIDIVEENFKSVFNELFKK
jgi:hypothetical protein